MAKVQIKSEKVTAFGGIFFVLDKFDSILSSSHWDRFLGMMTAMTQVPVLTATSYSIIQLCIYAFAILNCIKIIQNTYNI